MKIIVLNKIALFMPDQNRQRLINFIEKSSVEIRAIIIGAVHGVQS